MEELAETGKRTKSTYLYEHAGFEPGQIVLFLIKSLNDSFLPDDNYLKDCSKDVIDKSKNMFIRPHIELYPQSSWLYLKNNHKEIYDKFNFYNKDNKMLNVVQINEINLYLNKIVEKIFKK